MRIFQFTSRHFFLKQIINPKNQSLIFIMSAEKSTDTSHKHYGFATNAIHLSQNPEKWDSRSVVTPLVLSSVFQHLSPGVCHLGYNYSRDSNPTRSTLEECLAAIEKAKYCVTYSSGQGAISAISYLLKTGDHVIMLENVYGGTSILFTEFLSDFGIETSFVDLLDLNATEKAFKQNTKMVWIDTPSNPLLKIVDIKAICEMAKKKNPNIIVVVDNTFATGYFQNPIELGADIVVMSLTKYMNGHTDVVMGALMLNDEKRFARLQRAQSIAGAVPSPFDCFLVLRGLKTLELRMNQHAASGLAIAKYLEKNPRVQKVIHPELESHPQHELYKRQMRGFGGMIALYIRGGKEETKNFAQSLKVFTLAASFGACESLVDIPILMSRESMPIEEKDKLDFTDNLVRLSVGLENVEDLINDLDQALIKSVPL